MFPWKAIITIQKDSELPIYLQVSNSIINGIKSGVLAPRMKMPGTRELSQLLDIHRKTAVKAYDELDAQGWVYSLSSKGTFISEHLPEVTPKKFKEGDDKYSYPEKAGYAIRSISYLNIPSKPRRDVTGFHDGADVRLVPIEQLARAYKRVMSRKSGMLNFSYLDARGREDLRTVLSKDLNTTHGMHTMPDNILITRGSQMAIYMIIQLLIEHGDKVVVGHISFYYVDRTFIDAGAELLRTKVDDEGIDVDQIEELCKKKKIRAVYVTPHHHYPTTVTLSAARRMKLLALAEKYRFVIIEDDYDYDFHYQSSPILPLASADKQGLVIYIGTFSKTVAPALRVGYLVAPKNLINELCKLRQIIDVQGDPFIEQAIAELYVLGELRRHMKKSVREYQLRRDFMCGLLKDRLGDVIDFKVPDGGLSIWAKFNKKFLLPDVADNMRKNGVIISSGLIHNPDGKKLNSTRMGFGWMNTQEAEHAVNILHSVIKK